MSNLSPRSSFHPSLHLVSIESGQSTDLPSLNIFSLVVHEKLLTTKALVFSVEINRPENCPLVHLYVWDQRFNAWKLFPISRIFCISQSCENLFLFVFCEHVSESAAVDCVEIPFVSDSHPRFQSAAPLYISPFPFQKFSSFHFKFLILIILNFTKHGIFPLILWFLSLSSWQWPF